MHRCCRGIPRVACITSLPRTASGKFLYCSSHSTPQTSSNDEDNGTPAPSNRSTIEKDEENAVQVNGEARGRKQGKRARFNEKDLLSVVQQTQKTLFVREMEDWYYIPKTHLVVIAKMDSLVNRYGTVEAIVRAAYPDHAWDSSKFVQPRTGKLFGAQRFLFRILRSIFGDEKVEINAKSGHGLKSENERSLEIDIFYPDLQLGFEYQDPHHYFTVTFGAMALSEYHKQDALKQKQAKEKGITLINIPFWWDWSLDRLVATIYKFRPELVKALYSPSSLPLEETPPKWVSDKFEFEIPGLGLPMLAMHAPRAATFDPKSWWVFEKVDGIRAIWDGDNRLMYSRWGRLLQVPNYILDTLPAQNWLDGEMWFGRDRKARFEAIKASRVSMHLIAWERFHFIAFDLPHPSLHDLPFSTRYSMLEKIVILGHPFVQISTYQTCTSKDFVESVYFKIRAQGGEGIILRYPDSPYVNGYSRFMYKHKGFFDDEAMVLERRPNNKFLCKVRKKIATSEDSLDTHEKIGKHKRAEEKDGEEGDGEEGTTDEGGETGQKDKGGDKRRAEGEKEKRKEKKREEKEKKREEEFYEVEMAVDEGVMDEGGMKEIGPGTFVSYRYTNEHAGSGPPVSPVIFSLRSDVTQWEQIIASNNAKQQAHQRIWMKGPNASWKDPKKRKWFFDELAKDKGFDPLVAKNWYSIVPSDINPRKGADRLMDYYGGSFVKAIETIYPDIGFDPSKAYRKRYFWVSQENRTQFFNDYAREKGFDPLVPENWYNDPCQFLHQEEGLTHYHKNVYEALNSAYPHIGLDPTRFRASTVNHWNIAANRKKEFDKLAQFLDFNPLIPERWYAVNPIRFKSKINKNLLKRYNGSYVEALMDIYPDIGLRPEKFISSKQPTEKPKASRKLEPPLVSDWPAEWSSLDKF
eukprot:Phypoly_transcript_02328.p1 GENE.Phypoly_transcript_02328~~Phypoly_transcript_02328.p1  ORF type:complete len:917 (+),score=144.55 Phypoly_transcript_02328:40-2790(+)